MRLVRLDDLSEEERKKALEEQNARIQANRQASEQIRVNANNQFNDYVSKNGGFDTSKHTFTLRDLKKTASKEYYKSFKKANDITLWGAIKQTASDLKSGTDKAFQSFNAKTTALQPRVTKNNIYEDMAKRSGLDTTNNDKNGGDVGRIIANFGLGGKVGIKNSVNFAYKSGELALKPEQQIKNKRVLSSDELNTTEKALYIASTNSRNLGSKNDLDINLPTSKIQINYDKEKVEEIANNNLIDRSIKKDEEKIQKNIEQQNNSVSRKLAELAPSAGNMATGSVLSAINPAVGMAYFTTSAAGSYMQDGLDRGMSGIDSKNYAIIMGLMEGATEVIGIDNISKAGKGIKTLIKGTGKTVLKDGIEDVGKTTLKSVLKNYGVGIADNVLQESIIEPIQEVVAGGIGGNDKANWENMGQRMLQTGVNGGLVSGIVGGGKIGIQSCIAVIEKAQNNQAITQDEITKAIQDASQELDVEKMIIDSTQQQISKYKGYNTNQKADNNITSQQSTIQNNANLLSQQQITSQENKMAQNGISKQKNILPIQNFIYEKSDNPRINNLRQDASEYWSNTEKTKNYVNMLEKIIQDKNIDIRLDANLKDSQGRMANGSYSNGVITINPNSTRAGEFIAVHELTHAIGTDQMKNIVQKYRESNAEFDTAVKSLLQNYNTTELTEEAMSDVAGQLFGNQEFINNLAQTEPSLFQKIYNEIKYLWHQFTGYKNQDQFINDLQYKWEQAYRSNNKLNEITNYSIQQNNNGKYIKVDTDQDIFNGIEEKDYNKIAKMYMQDYLKGNTKLSESDNATIGSKGINKYTNPKQQTKYMNEKMKLTPELKNVLEIAEKVQDSPPTKDTSKYPNWEYYKFNFELGGKNFEGLINIGIDKNGNKHFYEINKIHTTSNSYVSTNKSSSTDSINNSILPTQENVNSTTNNSMQESENNSGSFSMSENKRFDVTGNENLNNASTLFFRTREDGIYYVQATNAAGNITYDGTFIDKHSLEKTLGNEIAEYITNNSEHTNNEIYLTSSKVENETDYMMSHRPSEEYGNGSNFESNMNGVFEHPEWYMNMREEYNIESLNALQKVRNKPNATITIYRATPGNKINPGDWVTPSRKYAELHNNSQLNGAGNILELKVKAKDILWGGDDINEFGYFPDVKKYSLPTKEWQEYLEDNYKPTGTRTNLKDIKLPTQETSKEASINLPTNIDTKKVKFHNDNLIQESNRMSDEETAQILTEIKGRTNEKRKLSAFLKANLIDKGMVFEELARKTNNRDLQGKYDYTLTAEARGQNAIGNARYDYQTTVENGKIKKGNKNAKQISKSLTDIINEVGEDPTDFYNYMYHQLNIDRMTLEERFGGDTGTNYERKNTIKNKPVFGKGVTADISQKYVQELEQKHPEFKEYAQDVYDFLDANTKELVDNGIISKETQQLFKEMYPHYVPISRITNKGQAINVPLDTGRTGVNSPIKRAKGGNRDINPLFQTMADRTLQTYRASARNNFGIELKNTLDQAKQLNQTTELTDIDSIMESMTDEEQNNNLLQEGVNGENPTFTVFENGEKVTYEISKDMYDALKPKNELLKRIDNSMLSKGLNKVNNFRRGLLTEYNPVFSITNAIKDVQDVLLNSQHSAKTYSKIPEATAQILSKGYWYKEYIQNGGEQNSYFRDGEFDVTKKTLPTKTKEVVTLPLKAISSVNNVIEMTPRLAEYIVSRQQGRSIETSMLDASRVTTNFKAGGDVIKTLNRNGFTFLNASVQGMQQQIRNIQEANSKGLKGYAVLATKYAIAGLPVLILNNLIWDDDDDYEELQDYVKDNYYIIGKSKDGTFIRIPKGRAVATIQKIVSNANDFIKNDTINSDEVGKVFWEDLKENVSFAKDNLAPNNPLDNNVIAPITQVMSNKTWYGDALVPTRLQDKPKEEQYDETTDEISKWIGKHLKVSPMKVNYLLDQYSGGVGDILLPKLTPQAENTVLEDKFTTNPIMKNKYPGEFFEKIDELTVNKNSDKATDEDKLKYKYMSSVQNEMNDLYKEKREIQNSKATDEEKKKQLKELQKKINDLARNSLDKVEKITKGKNYAQIDTNQYYKDVEGNWEKVSEKDKEKNKESGLSLKTYSSYKYEMSKVKQEKVNKGEMTEEQSLKDNEQIQILLDSSYSDKDKSIIYEDYIKSSVKEGEYDSFEVIKASGININEYLKYEQQEFKSDKKDDGTLDGKTVSKSKQKKVESYLNSMNIEGNQRLLLYAMQGYSTTNSQKTQLANYVYGLNLDKETKLELYNKFSGFKVYKDGKVQW